MKKKFLLFGILALGSASPSWAAFCPYKLAVAAAGAMAMLCEGIPENQAQLKTGCRVAAWGTIVAFSEAGAWRYLGENPTLMINAGLLAGGAASRVKLPVAKHSLRAAGAFLLVKGVWDGHLNLASKIWQTAQPSADASIEAEEDAS